MDGTKNQFQGIFQDAQHHLHGAAQRPGFVCGLGLLPYPVGEDGPENNELAITLEKVLMVVIPVSLAAGYILFRVLLRSVQPGLPLVHKMKRYSSANLIRSAFLEVPGLFASVAALVTAHVLFLTIVPLILVLFILFRPTRSVIAQELGLSVAERAKLEDPAAIISETIE